MLAIHRGLMLLGVLLLALLVVGLFLKGKAKQCWTLLAYVMAAGLFTFLGLLFPERYTPNAYMIKQGIYDSLLFGMSLELSIRTFAAFRGIAGRARLFLAVAVALSSGLIFLATPARQASYDALVRFQPGVTTGGIWCLTFVALLIVWYQIPVPPFTRAIILGYVPYLVVFTIYVDLISRLGWGVLQHLSILNAIAFDSLAGYWAYAAWRKD